MKKIANIFFVLTMFFSISLMALPGSLGRTMKAMSADLKAISTNVAAGTLDETTALLADDLASLFEHSKDFSPDAIDSMPASQQAAAKAEYNKMLDQGATMGRQLAVAIRAQNIDLARTILNQLSQLKKDGHDEFKE